MNNRRKPERVIDAARVTICNAEMHVMHSFTDEDRAQALSELMRWIFYAAPSQQEMRGVLLSITITKKIVP